jgi:hypothetical protein
MLKAIRRTFRSLYYIPKPQDYKKDGDDIHWEDTSVFTYPVKGGRVIKVYDGDTITIASKIPIEKIVVGCGLRQQSIPALGKNGRGSVVKNILLFLRINVSIGAIG